VAGKVVGAALSLLTSTANLQLIAVASFVELGVTTDRKGHGVTPFWGRLQYRLCWFCFPGPKTCGLKTYLYSFLMIILLLADLSSEHRVAIKCIGQDKGENDDAAPEREAMSRMLM